MSDDTGQTWQLQTAPAQTNGMYHVACPDIETCYAVGNDVSDYAIVIGTQDAGATWLAQQTPAQPYALRSVSCAAVSTCWTSGFGPQDSPFMFATTDSGASWQRQDLQSTTSGGSPYVSCPTVAVCAAVSGGLTFATVDGGATWTDTEVPAGLRPPSALSCASRTVCVGVSNDTFGRPAAVTSQDGGKTWERHAMPTAAGQLYDVDCPSVTVCYAVSSSAGKAPSSSVSHGLWSTDAGVTWSEGKVVSKQGGLVRLSCPSTTTCLAGGWSAGSKDHFDVTTDSGATWQPVAPPPGQWDLDGLACTSVTSCVLLTEGKSGGSVAWTTSDLGGTYLQRALPDSDYSDVGCSAAICIAAGSSMDGGEIAASFDDEVTWQAQKAPSQALSLGNVSCGSARACAMTGYNYGPNGGPLIVGTTNAGKTWTPYVVPTRNQEPGALSCTGKRCIASDASVAGNPIIIAGKA